MKEQGYYVVGQPELGVFGPYSPLEIHRVAVEAGHVEEDSAREAAEIDRRASRFEAQVREKLRRSIQAAATSMDSAKMRSAADALDAEDETVASAVAAERERLNLELPMFIKQGVISIFRWDQRRLLVDRLAAEAERLAAEAEGQ